MTPALPAEVLDAQAACFARIDALLPRPDGPPPGDLVEAMLPDGSTVHGMHLRTALDRTNVARLWAAAEVHSLTPLVGDTGTRGMNALLDAWQARLAEHRPGTDSACMITWPSHDVAATRAFLDHGMVPAVVIAVRGASGPDASGDGDGDGDGKLVIRRARTADASAAVELALAEMRYSAQVGAPAPPNADELRTRTMLNRLADGGPTWLAERGGRSVGLADCGWVEVGPTSSYARQLPAGRWGYINCLSVLPAERGSGVGSALVRTAHAEFARGEAIGSFLFYTPANPLSSVFWPRRGYRPLWTVWEIRPASALGRPGR